MQKLVYVDSLAKGNPNVSFKEQNPLLCTRLEFKTLYDMHKLKLADKIMWSIVFLEDSNYKDNPYARMPRHEILESIRLDHCPEFSEAEYKTQIEGYRRWVPSFERKLLDIQRRKLDELTQHLDSLTISIDDKNDKEFDRYMKISEKLGKMWDNYDKAEKRLQDKEKKSEQTHGNKNLSKAEERFLGKR